MHGRQSHLSSVTAHGQRVKLLGIRRLIHERTQKAIIPSKKIGGSIEFYDFASIEDQLYFM
jgi:hypothetical protein